MINFIFKSWSKKKKFIFFGWQQKSCSLKNLNHFFGPFFTRKKFIILSLIDLPLIDLTWEKILTTINTERMMMRNQNSSQLLRIKKDKWLSKMVRLWSSWRSGRKMNDLIFFIILLNSIVTKCLENMLQYLNCFVEEEEKEKTLSSTISLNTKDCCVIKHVHKVWEQNLVQCRQYTDYAIESI